MIILVVPEVDGSAAHTQFANITVTASAKNKVIPILNNRRACFMIDFLP
jgi:hypothetical protein